MEGLGLIKSYVKLVRDTLRAKRKPPCGWQTDDVSLPSETICAKFAHTAEYMKRYNTLFYNLDAIISVGYRVNSIRATQFRQ